MNVRGSQGGCTAHVMRIVRAIMAFSVMQLGEGVRDWVLEICLSGLVLFDYFDAPEFGEGIEGEGAVAEGEVIPGDAALFAAISQQQRRT